MDLQEIIEFTNQNQLCYVATNEGEQPRVRAFLMWFADETGFYFHSAVPKRVYKQLINNPRIEVCFYPPQTGKMLRVTGQVEFIDDLNLKKRLVAERPFLKEEAGMSGDADPKIAIFRIYTGEAWFWTMKDNMRESELETVKF
jgi:pyridoxamine 5'-phosphate oxidase